MLVPVTTQMILPEVLDHMVDQWTNPMATSNGKQSDLALCAEQQKLTRIMWGHFTALESSLPVVDACRIGHRQVHTACSSRDQSCTG